MKNKIKKCKMIIYIYIYIYMCTKIQSMLDFSHCHLLTLFLDKKHRGKTVRKY